MKRAVCVTLLIGLLIGIAPISVNAAVLEYNKWYKVSDTIFNDIEFDPQNSQVVYAAANDGLYISHDNGDHWEKYALLGKKIVDITIADSNTLYAGYSAGGDWKIAKSTDGGKNWVDVLSTYGIEYVAISKSNPNIIYVVDYNYIYKSTDGGQTWKKDNSMLAARIWDIEIDPENADTVYVAVWGVTKMGIYKKTKDSEEWIRTHNGFKEPIATDIEISAKDPKTLYAASSGVFKSNDGGQNWIKISDKTCVKHLLIDSTNHDVLYAYCKSFFEKGILKSIDGGKTWADIDPNFRPYDIFSLYQDTRDPRILYTTAYYPSGTYKLIQSTPTNNLPPRNLKAIPGNKQVTLQWTPPEYADNISGYYVYKSVTPGNYGEPLVFTKDTVYVDKEVENGYTYHYVVRALHTDSTVSPISNEVFAIPQVPKPSGTIVLRIGNPHMTVNGVRKEIDPGRGTVPVVVKGRTLLPIRAIVEAMGGTVGWDGKANKVTIKMDKTTIILTIGKKQATVNGKTVTLDVAPQLLNDRTMVPLRFVVESLGAIVEWEDVTQTVTIRYGK